MTFNGFGINFPLFTHFCLLTRAHTHKTHTKEKSQYVYPHPPRARIVENERISREEEEEKEP